MKVDDVILEKIHEMIGETQVALQNCVEEIVDPVNYRATVAYSVMSLMYRYMIERDEKFHDFVVGELLQTEADPGRVSAVTEWLESIKGE